MSPNTYKSEVPLVLGWTGFLSLTHYVGETWKRGDGTTGVGFLVKTRFNPPPTTMSSRRKFVEESELRLSLVGDQDTVEGPLFPRLYYRAF